MRRLLLSVDHAHMAWCIWTIYVTHVIDTRSIRARMQSRRRCVVLWLGKYWISRGRNVLLQGNSWILRFDGLSLRFWQKTNSFATLTRVFFSQTSTRVHQILIPTHNQFCCRQYLSTQNFCNERKRLVVCHSCQRRWAQDQTCCNFKWCYQ